MSPRVFLFVYVCIGILSFLQFNQQLLNYSPTSYYDDTTTTTTFTTSIDAILGVSDDATLEKKDTTASISSPSSNMMGSRTTITTMQGRQGFHFPLDLLEWNLPSPTRLQHDVAGSSTSSPSSLSGRNFTNSICTTKGGTSPAPWIELMFNTTEWEFIPKASKTSDPSCSNSRIRVLWEGLLSTKPSQISILREDIKQHAIGEQLTATVLGARINKEELWLLIQNQTTSNDPIQNDHRTLLKDSLPTTRTFDSTTSCKSFCDGEWLKSQQLQHQQWIWKPKNRMKGKGIVLVGENSKDDGGGDDDDASSLEACHQHCKREGGESLLAQEVADAMLVPDDGRKFDVRSYVLVANVDPLVVFSGAELVRVCAEPMNATSPEPYPGIPANSSWNPFQQVCNIGLGMKHPSLWTTEGNTGPLEKGIPDDAVRQYGSS